MNMSAYLPNRLNLPLAIVGLVNGKPVPTAWRRMHAWQIIGGRTWSLSVIRLDPIERQAPYATPEPEKTQP